MERKGTVITCDRCGAQAFGETVTESGVGVAEYPGGWAKKLHILGLGYVDLCSECADEYEKWTKAWWRRGAKVVGE